ncbi:hypothetical protein [Delftia sp. ASV31]|uniref:hypothetical protein n=1 Tax=Delftia sp. ASV31 TaxID=2795113 RepID=UPI0018EB4B60|nr:hypothetical protein [Delftia sp. ASV31]
MIFSPVRAIAIDNNSLELISIVNGLSGRGIACSAHLYDSGDLIPAPPAGGYPHLRLAFVDMNLLDAAGFEAKNVASIIASVLKNVVAENCGPYCLVFWTSFPDKVNEVSPEVLRQLKQQGIPQPSTVTCLGKAEVVPLTNDRSTEEINVGLRSHFEEQAKIGENLENSLAEVLKKSGAAALASAWETMLCEAASSTFSQLYGQAKSVNEAQAGQVFADLLAIIATEAVGQKNARDEPLVALTEGLLELVVDHLRSAASAITADEIVKAELSQKIKNGIDPLPVTTIAQVNRLFQIELLDKGKFPTRTLRGLTLKPSDGFLKAWGGGGGDI